MTRSTPAESPIDAMGDQELADLKTNATIWRSFFSKRLKSL